MSNFKSKYLLLILSILLLPLFAVQAESAYFSASSLNVKPGDSFAVIVYATDLVSAGTIDVVLSYDSASVEFLSLSASDGIMAPLFMDEAFYSDSVQGSDSTLSVTVSSATKSSGSGKLLTVNFRLKSTVSNPTAISMKEFTVYKSDFSIVNVTAGSVLTIKPILIRADVDQNGSINATDAMLTLRKSVALSMIGTSWKESPTTGDVNCDGKRSSTDAMLILRYAVRLPMENTAWCE